MTGPYRARNPLLVASLYTADAFARLLSKPQKKIRDDRPSTNPGSQLGPSR